MLWTSLHHSNEALEVAVSNLFVYLQKKAGLQHFKLVPNLQPFGTYCATIGVLADSGLCIAYFDAFSDQ